MNVITDIAAQGLTRALCEQAHGLTYADLPDEVRALARQCVLDYVACTLAGASEPLTQMLLAEMAEQGGRDEAGVIGHATRLPAASAALVNGAAAHALDFDDVNMAMPGHPSVAILPALLALAEARGASGAALIAAFVAGYELQCRIGTTISPGHYDVLGFHATATVGSFGAAAACAHLLGLHAEQSATALGIAGTQAAGLKSMFGTMCKPLHAGKAAHHGLLAARLAARGFTSRADVLECAQGFARTHSPDFNPEQAFSAPPGGYYIRNNLFKYHAACYLTHAPIETARKLRAQHGVTPDKVARIHLMLDEACDRVCNIPAPVTGLEAKFSLRLTTAMALAGVDTGGLTSYARATAADPVLIALRDKVELEFRPGIGNTRAELTLELTDGTRLTAQHDSGVPAADLAEQGRRLGEKFGALAEPILGRGRAADLRGEIDRLDVLADLRGLMALCVP
ncbi:MAG TPA: MmgE/PrpD family protein [Acetobacteraceae bacterium]|jgi:2-methylcitrate dehydratase PrpD|nr:MmgE/PrpD family protein [Acetobacteraceae bacterium]